MHWPVLGIVPVFLLHVHHIYDWVTDATARAGGTFCFRGVWFGRFYGVVTADPNNVEYVLKTRFHKYPKGRYYRERFADFLGDGIFNADDDAWREQRRTASAEMHSAKFADYSAETIRNLVHRKLVPLLRRLADTVAAVDLQDVFLRFTFDNICSAAFGVDPCCLVTDQLPEVPFALAFEDATELTLLRFLMPPVVWKTMRRFDFGTEHRLRMAIRTVHEFAEETVRTRRGEMGLEDRSDLLSRLMSSGGNVRFTDKFLKDFCISFILAGRDTSSVALAWFFWLLHNNPRVEAQIQSEISAIVKQRRGPVAEEVVFTVEELKKMEYLQAALTESLRLYPSVPVDFKEATEDDVLPDGTSVKKGGRVIYSIYSMGRMEGIWGKDCREFRPERWLKEGVGFAGESPFKYVVFNAGPRLCVGKKFAYMQMKMVVAAILLRFRVAVEEGQEVVPKMTTTLYMKNGLRVTVESRNSVTGDMNR
ncbi:hypothetical protein HPP92_024524 [Vanilla planifolia]|uniref:noroxomaritidine synthase n=1 Tax=Vanilla planifolia TaxID=51239 RepID=A0A835PS95_VANPL|nr:hypothetical protein HPP92_024524 [Vanilla planifolia]